jgi:hypothetical protein
MCSQIINPGRDFLQHKYPNCSTQRSDTVTAGTLRRKEAANAVNFRDQAS